MAPKRRKSKKTQPKNSKVVKVDDCLSDWLKAMANYIEETQATVLDLSSRGLQKEEVKLILNVLADSKVTELKLDGNCFEKSVTDFAPLLTRTKIQKLNPSFCKLAKDDLFQLVKLLKDTQVTDLTVDEKSDNFTLGEARTFISNLQKSNLTTLRCKDFFNLLPLRIITSFVQDISSIASITSLDFSNCRLSSSDLICLFSNLGRSSVTDLNLDRLLETDRRCSGISFEALQELSRRIVETKIEKLSLCGVGLDENKLSSLVQGLIGSKVIDLDLGWNRLTCVDPLLGKLQETQIRTLNLSNNFQLRNQTFMYADSFRCSSLASLDLCHCCLSDEEGEALMESLRLSKVTKLNVSWNDFGLLTVKKLAESISEINLLDLDISFNKISLEGSFILGRCLKESKLTRIDVSGMFLAGLNSSDLISFLKLTEGSSVSQIEMNNNAHWFKSPLNCELNTLANTPLTELHLCQCEIGVGVLSGLIYTLKKTLTHLNLPFNHIKDDVAAVLADCLKGTQIRRLCLEGNDITTEGAKALALSLKETNLLYLDLRYNEIEDDGVEFLAEYAKDSFVTELNVFSSFVSNSRKSILLVDKVLWDNKITVHKLVTFFRQIAPKKNNDEFCFDPNSDDVDVSTFLEKCMSFYKTIISNPSAIGVLLEEKIVSLSREKFFKLVSEEFPRQFSHFIAFNIDADVKEHVKILEKAEEMELSAVVEELLFNRGAYVLDRERDVLHPSAYRLLLKYKQLICSLAIEPRAVTKIIEYFTEYSDVEGAQDVINLLRSAKIS